MADTGSGAEPEIGYRPLSPADRNRVLGKLDQLMPRLQFEYDRPIMEAIRADVAGGRLRYDEIDGMQIWFELYEVD